MSISTKVFQIDKSNFLDVIDSDESRSVQYRESTENRRRFFGSGSVSVSIRDTRGRIGFKSVDSRYTSNSIDFSIEYPILL